MDTGIVAVGAAAIAYYVYSRLNRDVAITSVETHRHVEHAPHNWTGELYLFAEALRWLYLEYITQWHKMDLFIGVFYLARQGIRDYPAAEVVAHGSRVHPKSLAIPQARNLKTKFETMHRLLLYSQKLRNTSSQVPVELWEDLQICESDFVVYRPKASVLCPAYVIIKDRILNSFVLAIRGTHTTRDIFTSLSGAVKPHHYVDQHGVVMGYSHFGMLAAARWIFKHCKATLIDAHESQPDYKLILTGHSMGGGTAAMLTMMIREQVPQFANAQCYTFACPACMTIEIAKSCSPYVTTLIYGTDVIPTISPAAGDLLREEVAKSSWSASFREDIRSSPFVQNIESGVKKLYRSASTWTARQTRSVANLTTRCYRPRHRSSQLNGRSEENERKEPLTNSGDGETSESTEQRPPDSKAETKSNPDEGKSYSLHAFQRSASISKTTFSEMWSKMSSFSWRKKVSDADSISNNESPDESDGVVEGVFNAQGVSEEHEESNDPSNASTSNTKRLLYPAGHIYHLVPEYILEADVVDQGSDQTSDSEDSVSKNWYRPNVSTNEDSEESDFVLFSDVPQEAYGRIRVCRSMVADHFLPQYKIALESAICDLSRVFEGESVVRM